MQEPRMGDGVKEKRREREKMELEDNLFFE
jgi:hypothetical protein